MSRKIYYWKLRDSEMQLGERTLLMGVLNVTPDSFSDGGRYNDPDRACARALELEEQGADIIDIGAESTKPGSQRITLDEEWQRLVPVLKRLRGNLRVPLSIDTYKSEVAERALEYGVEIFNDPTGLTFDPNLARVAATGNAGLILNHMRGLPESWAKLAPMKDLLGSISRELEATASRARLAGVERGRIIIDPGLGFGKRKEQNAEILAHLHKLAALDYPILVGPSRKSFLAKGSEAETLYATAAAVAAAVLNGAHIVRVHDVKEMQAAVQVAEEIARAAAATAVPAEAERPVSRARSHSGPNFEAERPRPTRAPIAKKLEPVILPVADAVEKIPVESAAGESPETTPETAPEERAPEEQKKKAPISQPPVERPRRVFARPVDGERASRGDSRPPRAPYPDRDKRDGTRPPSRPPFTPRGPAPRSGPPPRGRDFRPGQDARSERPAAGQDRFKPSGPKRPFTRDNDRRDDRRDDRPPRQDRGDFRPPRSGPAGPRSGDARPPYKPSGFRPAGPPRSFDRGGGDSREGRSFERPTRSAGPPRSGPPRSGPPRGDRDRPDKGPSSGPPKRPFRKRP